MVVVGVRRDDAPEAFSSVPGAGQVLINVRRHHGGGWNEAAALPRALAWETAGPRPLGA